MKKITLLFLFGITNAQIPSGQTVIDSMTAIMSPENSKGLIRQTNVYENGKSRTFDLEMFSGQKGEKSLMRYLKPTSVKGQTFLMLNSGDDIWTYFPRTRRVRKLASHAKKQKVQGGDFSFEDFSSEDTWNEDYSVENRGNENLNGVSCWLLKAVAKPGADVDYPLVMLWVRRDNYYPVQIDYQDEKGRIEKSLTLDDIQLIDGIPTAKTIVMKNVLSATKTIMETVEISFDWVPPKGFFSERNLKK